MNISVLFEFDSTDILISLFEAVTSKFRFKPKIHRKSVKKQRGVYASQSAARLAKKLNPGLAKRKEMYRKKYLDLKKMEQARYGSRGMAAARKH